MYFLILLEILLTTCELGFELIKPIIRPDKGFTRLNPAYEEYKKKRQEEEEEQKKKDESPSLMSDKTIEDRIGNLTKSNSKSEQCSSSEITSGEYDIPKSDPNSISLITRPNAMLKTIPNAGCRPSLLSPKIIPENDVKERSLPYSNGIENAVKEISEISYPAEISTDDKRHSIPLKFRPRPSISKKL